MKKVLITAAALSMIASAAHATSTAYSDAQAAYTGVSGAYSALGGNIHGSAGGTAFNTMLNNIQDRVQAGGLQPCGGLMFGGAGVGGGLLCPTPPTGTVAMPDVVTSVTAVGTAVTADFVGSDGLAAGGTLVGDSVGRIQAAATAYGATDWTTATATEARAAYDRFMVVYNREAGHIRTADAGVSNLNATTALSNNSNVIAAAYEVGTARRLPGHADSDTALSYGSRLDRLAGNFSTAEISSSVSSQPGNSNLIDVHIPVGWSVNAYDAATGNLTLTAGTSITNANVIIDISAGTDAATRSAAIKSALNAL